MTNTLGELLISHERLSLYQTQLNRISQALQTEAQRLAPINEQVQQLYDHLATPQAQTPVPLSAPAGSDFDSLQWDQYTDLHGTLQDFQELLVRSQETRADVDLVSREVQAALDQFRLQLDSLRSDLTQSRLVPFRTLAQKFIVPLQQLSQQYGKQVTLAIEGEEVLVDQVVLEQLQSPLTHLVRNAFDHGLEYPSERIAADKPAIATLTLAARSEASQVIISLADDGRGIDLKRVQQVAIAQGLLPPDPPPTAAALLDCLFQPGFSTTTTTTTLSGRGVGLDAVQQEVNRLRGLIQVTTQPGQGSRFQLAIPLSLNILSLLLCKTQQRTLALPASDVLEIISLRDYPYPIEPNAPARLPWQGQAIPLYVLSHLLPYPGAAAAPPSLAYGLVVRVAQQPIALAVDRLLGERELVLKPLDPAIPVPAYVAGCTVLGSGEIVPILNPAALGPLLTQAPQQPTSAPKVVAPTILIAEDSLATRRLLEGILNKMGYQVLSCRDGKEALTLLEQPTTAIDLVLTDLEMPRLDGLGLIQSIRTLPKRRELAVIVLTSRDNPQHRQKAQQTGANHYLTKPFTPQDLLQAIATFLPTAVKA